MLNFIIGEKGSGKTAYSHRIIGEAAQKGESVMLIVPRQFSFESDKSILSLLGPRLASEIEVLSFKRLCDETLKSYGATSSPVATAGVKNILMSLAVEAVSDSLKVFAKHKNDIALSRKMLLSVEEIKNSGISAEDLNKCADKTEDKMLSEKMKETSLIYSAYEALLSKDFFDEANLLSYVADVLKTTDFFKDKTIVIDGYSDFSFGELRIIEQMLLKAKQVYVTLCIKDESDISDLSPFAIVGKTLRRLRLLAGNNGIEVGSTVVTKRSGAYPCDLDFLEKNIFSPVEKRYGGACENITLTASNTLQSECDDVARKIKALIRRGEYRCRDIAVVFRSEGAYEKGIKLSFKKYGVPFFEDKRQPVWNQPLVCIAVNLLDICSEGFSSDSIFRYLKTGLTPLEEQDISELENYVYAWDIEGKRWLAEWTDNPDGFGVEMNDERKERLAYINSLREKTVTPVLSFKEECENKTGRQIAENLFFYLTENGIDLELKKYALDLEERGFVELALEQEQVWDFLMECLNELADTLSERKVTLKRFSELFALCVQSKSLGKIPDGFDEVIVCPAQRILTKNAKVVFAVGLNADVFPLKQSESGIFSRREKILIASNGIESINDSKDEILFERFLAYNTLCCATQKLHLSYCLSDSKDKNLAKSEYIEAVQGLFPTLKETFSSDSTLEELIESEQSAFEIMAKNWNGYDGKTKALKEYFRSREDYGGRFLSISRAAEKRELRFENADNALSFFGKNLYFSATQLDDYGACPFKYFCRHGLKAKPRLKADFDPAQTGNAVHYVLENLLQKYKGGEFLALSEKEFDGEISRLLNEYMEAVLSGGENKTERFNYLYYRMHKVVSDIIGRLQGEFSESDFEPCDFELNISRESDVQPFTVELEQGMVEFCGKIDRVDKLDIDEKRYVRVVDYKTGTKDFKLNDVMNGINMQMLLYLVSMWRNGRGFYEQIIPAGVLYFPARIETVKSERGYSSEERTRARHMNSKMKGVLIDDEEIIRRMDKKGEGLYLPLSFNAKTGQPKGNLISLKALERLAKHMDNIIRNMGDNLHKGNIPARPLMGTDHTNTCLYCHYGDICMTEKPRYRFIENMSHAKCIEKLMKEEEDEQNMD